MDAALKLTLPRFDPATPNLSSVEDPVKVREAAEQFEALLIGQVLRAAREAGGGGGWFGTEEEAGQALGELAEQQLAQTMAAQGGFGLAPLIRQGLERNHAPSGTRTPAAASD